MLEMAKAAIDLKFELLDSPVAMAYPTHLAACLNSHGLYSPFQFVLRLSPEIHRKLESISSGLIHGHVDFECLQAYSTYLHETIHWWQHIGSTTGLLLSLSYPAQAHTNSNYLRSFAASIGAKKSIRRYVEDWGGPGGPEAPDGIANVIVNNHFDVEFFRALVINPRLIEQAITHPFFDCIGHSYQIAYGSILLNLASTIDGMLQLFDDPRDWSPAFRDLRSRRVMGFYHGSDVRVVPIGTQQIFEGQARFGQLQFLHFISRPKLTWDDARRLNMLSTTYREAFEHFLRLAELDWPNSIDHPVVALFLLVCDIALNPSAGFPLPLRIPKTFVEDVDPSTRFAFLCRTIARSRPETAGMITKYSRAEYQEVSEALCRPMLVDPPLAISETACRWLRHDMGLRGLMEEHGTFAFDPRNLPVRLVFSHFLAFCQDKLAKPEFFCWPGVWMTGERASEEGLALLERHSAPFLDKPEDSGIYPRLMNGRDQEVVQNAFNSFYAMNLVYDLTRQWIAVDGPFEYEYRWLSSTASPQTIKDFADRHFQTVYGVHPDSFDILQKPH